MSESIEPNNRSKNMGSGEQGATNNDKSPAGDNQQSKGLRRNILKKGGIGTALAASGLAVKGEWIRPVVQSAILPAHSATSNIAGAATVLNGFFGQPITSFNPEFEQLPDSPMQIAGSILEAVFPISTAHAGEVSFSDVPTPGSECTGVNNGNSSVCPPDPSACPIFGNCCEVKIAANGSSFVLTIFGLAVSPASAGGTFTGTTGSTTILDIPYTIDVNSTSSPTSGMVTAGPGGFCNAASVVASPLSPGACSEISEG